MPLQQYILDNSDDVISAVRSELTPLCTAGASPVVLLPSSTLASHFRRAFADSSCALGTIVSTFTSWIKDRWELLGDSRHLVSAMERKLLLALAYNEVRERAHGDECASVEERALEEEKELPFDLSPGVIDLLAQLAEEALPDLLAVDTLRADEVGLSDAECVVLGIMQRYAELLEEESLCEFSQASAELTVILSGTPMQGQGALVQEPLILACFDTLSLPLEKFSAALAQTGEVMRFDDGCRAVSTTTTRAEELTELLNRLGDDTGVYTEPLSPTGAVRFLLPAGRYAAGRLISDCICEQVTSERKRAVEEGREALPVAVTAKDPRALFEDIADDLALCGITAAVRTKRPFANTAFGRAFLSLLAFEFDDEFTVVQASDFALSPFSGIDREVACELDASWRGDRTIARNHMERDLAGESSVVTSLLEVLKDRNIEAALKQFELKTLQRADFNATFLDEQLAAIRCAQAFSETCERVGTTLLDQRELLAQLPVGSNIRTMGANDGDLRKEADDNHLYDATLKTSVDDPDVLFLTQAEAANLDTCSCTTIVLCDLVESAYPIRANEDAASLLLEKLDLAQESDPLTLARRQFFRVLSCARDVVVCERILNTVDADEAYPAVMLEELLDCYRSLAQDVSSDDEPGGLPNCLVPFRKTAGEEKLHLNLSLGDRASRAQLSQQDGSLAGQTWDIPETGVITLQARYIVPRSSERDPLKLSPSAIESYLECPYKWFAQRRLRLNELDAGCGPLEMGSFAHEVLECFYKQFQDKGYTKVDAENLSRAQDLIQDIFEQHLERQTEQNGKRSRRGQNKLIPCTKLEEAEVGDLERQLVNYLEDEVNLLPGYTPTRFEFNFGNDEVFEYAGIRLNGTIDRIDVNDRGQAVIIDYKGSLSNAYDLATASALPQADDLPEPHKVQALIYAQVARRLLGLDVVGAVYVSYGRNREIHGAFDSTVLGPSDLLGIKESRSAVPGEASETFETNSFSQLVDNVEAGIAAAAQSLAQGNVMPCPHGDDACKYCPVLTCERRRLS